MAVGERPGPVRAARYAARGIPDISAIDVSADGLTATIHFKDLYSGWLGWLTHPILPEHYFKTIPVKDAAKLGMPKSPAIAKVPWSGPFEITAATPSEIDYARNPYWHGGVSGPHAAYLDHLKLVYYGSKDGMIADFLAGNVDLIFDLTQADYPAVSVVSPSVGQAQLLPSLTYEHFGINNDPTHARGNGLWDVKVRTALAMAVNKAALLTTIFPGQTVAPACSRTPPGEWYRKDETCPAYDPAGASQLLAQAGWVKDASGYVANAGHEMNLELCTTSGNPTRLTEIQLLQNDLKAIGVKSHIVTADAGSVVFASWGSTTPTTDCSIYRGTYDISLYTGGDSGNPYNDYYFAYSSSAFPELGDHSGVNDTRFSSPAMDAALATLKTAVDPATVLPAAQAVQDAYNAGVPEIPLYYRANTTGVGARAGNWIGESAISDTWNVEDWYVK